MIIQKRAHSSNATKSKKEEGKGKGKGPYFEPMTSSAGSLCLCSLLGPCQQTHTVDDRNPA